MASSNCADGNEAINNDGLETQLTRNPALSVATPLGQGKKSSNPYRLTQQSQTKRGVDMTMTIKKPMIRKAAFFLVAAVLLPAIQPAFGAGPARIADVGLTSAGALMGQVVDSQGKPVANSPVEIAAAGRKPTLATTNDQGYFAVNNLSAGVYVASAPGTSKMVRVWSPRTAPPAASQGVLLVQPELTARAQSKDGKGSKGGGGLMNCNWKCIAIGVGIGGGLAAIIDYNPSGS